MGSQMNEPSTAVLSVRGEASRLVPPDSGLFHAAITCVRPTKADALTAAGAAVTALTAELAAIGGRVRTPERSPLSWAVDATSTRPEMDYERKARTPTGTGRTYATVALRIQLRDFDRIDDVAAILEGIDELDVRGVSWDVDADNPAWPEVRADAIRAAVTKGRDYAAALGGALVRVEQIADAGLLGSSGSRLFSGTPFAQSGWREQSAPQEDRPSLDPQPQELAATVEARLLATVAPLAQG